MVELIFRPVKDNSLVYNRLILRRHLSTVVSLDEPKGINDNNHPYNTFGWTDSGWNAARVSRNIIDRISPILDTKSKYLPSENLIIKTSLH